LFHSNSKKRDNTTFHQSRKGKKKFPYCVVKSYFHELDKWMKEWFKSGYKMLTYIKGILFYYTY